MLQKIYGGYSDDIPAVSYPITVSNGGTGQATQQAAINALTGTQSSGKFLRSDGANATLDTIKSNDIAVAVNGYTNSTTGTVILTASSNPVQVITGAVVASWTLPDATTLTVNRTFRLINKATANIGNVKNNAGTLVFYTTPGQIIDFVCTDTSTAAGTWSAVVTYSSAIGGAAVGYGNTVIGSRAGGVLQSGASCTAFGAEALTALSTSGNSSAFGYGSLTQATGSGNQGVGYNSASAVTTGAYNNYSGAYTGNTLGHATASNNVILSDGQANIVFIAKGTTQPYNANTTWTPADASGATLTLTVTNANYSSVSNWVRFTTTLAYPVTADTNAAVISGLPRAVANQALIQAFSAGLGIGLIGIVAASGTSIALYNSVTGIAVTNANLSGATLTISSVYNT